MPTHMPAFSSRKYGRSGSRAAEVPRLRPLRAPLGAPAYAVSLAARPIHNRSFSAEIKPPGCISWANLNKDKGNLRLQKHNLNALHIEAP